MWIGHTGQRAHLRPDPRRSAYLGTRFARITRPGEVVGLMLPTSIGGALAFWGLQYAHRIPAWLNFSMGSAAFASTVKTTGLKTVLTSRKFVTDGRLRRR
jgi:acyl-[acyl-carrier-protein]-phospholipid O-acyltransferase/long-chain-fatty-acid--[acyl-carrier-protein] ligase